MDSLPNSPFYNPLYELEEAGEACDGEDAADFFADVADAHFASHGLGVLQDAEEDAQAAGGDVLKFAAVEDDVVALAVVEHFALGGCLGSGGGVETAFEVHH